MQGETRVRSGFRALHALLIGLAGLLIAIPSQASNAAKGDRDFGQYLSSLCVTCHQITGQTAGNIPPIVAWPDDQFIAVMNAYRMKDRENLVMQNIAGKLSDEEIAALAAYFGSLPHQPAIK
jgi:cytochrome c